MYYLHKLYLIILLEMMGKIHKKKKCTKRQTLNCTNLILMNGTHLIFFLNLILNTKHVYFDVSLIKQTNYFIKKKV